MKTRHTMSPVLPVCSGVPQESVLGPLLFAVHVNDLLKLYETHPRYEIECFADDTVMYVSGTQENETIQRLNAAIQEIASLFDTQSLPLNEKKSVAILIRGERKTIAGNEFVTVKDKKLSWLSLYAL